MAIFPDNLADILDSGDSDEDDTNLPDFEELDSIVPDNDSSSIQGTISTDWQTQSAGPPQTGDFTKYRYTQSGGTGYTQGSGNQKKQNGQTTTGQNIQIDPKTVPGSGNISIGGNVSVGSGAFTFGPDPETVEKVREALKKQQKKIDMLREVMIDFLAENEVSKSAKLSWKSDFDKIREAEESMPDADGKAEKMTEDAVLGPDTLERLNGIYKRWSE